MSETQLKKPELPLDSNQELPLVKSFISSYEEFMRKWQLLYGMNLASVDTLSLYNYYIYRAFNNVFESVPRSLWAWHLDPGRLGMGVASDFEDITLLTCHIIKRMDRAERQASMAIFMKNVPKYRDMIF